MVLDEDALEAMLRRQNASDGDEPPAQATLTDETDEFEVYERPQREDAAPAREEPTPQAQAAPQEMEAPEPPRQAPQVMPSAQPERREPAAPAPVAPESAAPSQRTHNPDPTPHAGTSAPQGGGTRIGLVHCRFNNEITDKMVALAERRAQESGASVTKVAVAGVYDAPLAAQRLARRDDIDGVVVIGVVVTGDTDHDQVITHATATNLQRVALDTDKPVGLGVTGPGMSWAEAEARVGNAAHAVDAVLEMVAVQV